jgi:NADH-quinone oxidoreductase subunit M
MPMWPVHTWLPDAHVQAPTAGSVILAGVLLKMGGYGSSASACRCSRSVGSSSFRSSTASRHRGGLHLAGRAGADRHEEADRLLVGRAYGLRHLRPVRLQPAGHRGRDDRNAEPRPGVGRALPCVGVIYDRLHTREISRYGGLADNMPKYALLFMVFTMASVGLPGTSGFVGEFLSLVGTYAVSSWAASSRPPASSSARPICSISTGAFATAAWSMPMRRR